MSTLFLTSEEVAILTGIKRGRAGKSRNQLQCEHLRAVGIPFFPNAAGQPKVPRSYIEGTDLTGPNETKKRWQPHALRKAA